MKKQLLIFGALTLIFLSCDINEAISQDTNPTSKSTEISKVSFARSASDVTRNRLKDIVNNVKGAKKKYMI
jgi:hypothetical protein